MPPFSEGKKCPQSVMPPPQFEMRPTSQGESLDNMLFRSYCPAWGPYKCKISDAHMSDWHYFESFYLLTSCSYLLQSLHSLTFFLQCSFEGLATSLVPCNFCHVELIGEDRTIRNNSALVGRIIIFGLSVLALM